MNIDTVRVGDKEVTVIWYVVFGTPLLYDVFRNDVSVVKYFNEQQLERLFNYVLRSHDYV